jgi:hypothetical protein
MAAVRNIEFMSKKSNAEKKALSWIRTCHGGGYIAFDLVDCRRAVPKGPDVSEKHIVANSGKRVERQQQGTSSSETSDYLQSTWLYNSKYGIIKKKNGNALQNKYYYCYL